MHFLEPSELTALLTAAYNRNRLHHMAMLVSVCHGMRVSDMINLESSDIQGAFVRVNKNHLKNNGEQLQPLHFSENPIFDERNLMIHAGRIADNPALKDKRLFPLCRQRIDQLVKAYGKQAGIPRIKCHSHATGRHTCGHLVFEASHSLSQVQQILGHRSVNTTLIYLQEAERSKGIASLHAGLESAAQGERLIMNSKQLGNGDAPSRTLNSTETMLLKFCDNERQAIALAPHVSLPSNATEQQ